MTQHLTTAYFRTDGTAWKQPTYNRYVLHDWNADRRHKVDGCFVALRWHDTADLKHADVTDWKLVPCSSASVLTTTQNYPTHISARVLCKEVDCQWNDTIVYTPHTWDHVINWKVLREFKLPRKRHQLNVNTASAKRSPKAENNSSPYKIKI